MGKPSTGAKPSTAAGGRGRWIRQRAGRVRKNPKFSGILIGMDEIADFMGVSHKMVYVLLKDWGLPATKLPTQQWYTHKALVLQWIVAGGNAYRNSMGWKPLDKDKLPPVEDYVCLLKDLTDALGIDLTYEQLVQRAAQRQPKGEWEWIDD